MSPFDAAVYVIGLFAIVTGFNAGLLRSLATILAYAIAAPVTLAVAPRVSEYLTGHALLQPDQTTFVPFATLMVLGFGFGALMRSAVGGLAGEHIGFIDRVLGAVLGAVRVALLAVLIVLIFGRLIPPGREPAWYADSKLRPYLAAAGEKGLRALPSDIGDYIERMKRERGY